MKWFSLLPLVYLATYGIKDAHNEVTQRDDCTCGQANFDSVRRIVNGEQTTPNKYPWMASLIFIEEVENYTFATNGCGGSVISDRNILTAAHCFHPPNGTALSIDASMWSLGMHNISSEDQEYYSTIDYALHPEYHHFVKIDQSDLLIVLVDRQITFSQKVQPICLPEPGAVFADKEGIIAGWGLTFKSKDNVKVTDILLEITAKILPTDKCAKIWAELAEEPESIFERWMVCAKDDTNKSACNGDSGGPLMINKGSNHFEIVGVASFGDHMCTTHVPTVFASVSDPETIEWINGYITQSEGAMCPPPKN